MRASRRPWRRPLGCSVGLCTSHAIPWRLMPCKPAVGGTAKGHLVREIDALGGYGRASTPPASSSSCSIDSGGRPVWSPRAQADKRRYAAWVVETSDREPNPPAPGKSRRDPQFAWPVKAAMETRSFELSRARHHHRDVSNGLIHVGSEQRPAGRHGDLPHMPSANPLRTGLRARRLKTARRRGLIAAASILRRRSARRLGRGVGPRHGAVSFATTHRLGNRIDCWCAKPTIGCGISSGATSRRSRSSTANPGHRPALLPVARRQRSCDFPESREAPDLPRAGGSTSTRSTSTGFR
jgi:hypothetical protein